MLNLATPLAFWLRTFQRPPRCLWATGLPHILASIRTKLRYVPCTGRNCYLSCMLMVAPEEENWKCWFWGVHPALCVYHMPSVPFHDHDCNERDYLKARYHFSQGRDKSAYIKYLPPSNITYYCFIHISGHTACSSVTINAAGDCQQSQEMTGTLNFSRMTSRKSNPIPRMVRGLKERKQMTQAVLRGRVSQQPLEGI